MSNGDFAVYRNAGWLYGSSDIRDRTFRYPNPWLDVASQDSPTSVRDLMRIVADHVLWNPLVSAATRKMSTYAVTDILVESSAEPGFDRGKKRWEALLLQQLKLRSFLMEVGLDRFSSGNCFVSLYYPFDRYLVCPSGGCGHAERLTETGWDKTWLYRNGRFALRCPKCGAANFLNPTDKWVKDPSRIRLLRWEATQIDIDHNATTGSNCYYYTLPSDILRKSRGNDPQFFIETSNVVLDAAYRRRPVRLDATNLFHFAAPSPSISLARGWGIPPVMPVLKDLFYAQVMKKANETVFMEHILPLDVIFPATGDSKVSPYLHQNLKEWVSKMEQMIIRWRRDPNFRPVLPLPVGTQRIGGDGKAMLLANEIRQNAEMVLAGMGVPSELVFGGLTWSGSSVSLRMLENDFLTHRDDLTSFVQHFLVPALSRFLGWPSAPRVSLREFKMADDVQVKTLLKSMVSDGMASKHRLMHEFNLDYDTERAAIRRERADDFADAQNQALQQAEIQAAVQRQQQQSAIEAQQAVSNLSETQASIAKAEAEESRQSPLISVDRLMNAWSQQVMQLSAQEQQQLLDRMAQSAPNTAQVLADSVRRPSRGTSGVDMRQAPQQRPPRRPTPAM